MLQKSIERDAKRLENIKKEEDAELNGKIEELRAMVWPDLKEGDAMERLREQRESQAIQNKKNELHTHLNGLCYTEAAHKVSTQKKEGYQSQVQELEKKLVSAQDSLTTRTCPLCKASLRLENDILVCTDTPKFQRDDVVRLETKLQKVKRKACEYDTKCREMDATRGVFVELNKRLTEVNAMRMKKLLPGTREVLETYLQENRECQVSLEKLRRQLERGGYSRTVKQLEKAVTSDRERLSEIQVAAPSPCGTEDELQCELQRLQILHHEKQSIEEQVDSLTEKLLSLVDQKQSVLNVVPDATSERLRRELSHYKRQIKKARAVQEPLRNLIIELSQYEAENAKYEKYKKLTEDLESLKQDRDETLKHALGAALLETKMRIAESKCLTWFTHSPAVRRSGILGRFLP